MEYFSVVLVENELQIQGIPDATLAVRVETKLAVRMAHLILHQADLSFAKRCLEEINKVADHSVIEESLWETAIIRFVKCFESMSRRCAINAKKNLWR